MAPKLSDYPPEEIILDGETFLQWRIPYHKKGGSSATAMITMSITLERFNNSPHDKQTIQTALDKLIAAETAQPTDKSA